MFKFCPPKTKSNVRPKRESTLYDINLTNCEVKCNQASQDFVTADGSLQILSISESREVENLLIVGGSGQRIDLFSKFNFDIRTCNLPGEFGGCVVALTTVKRERICCKICKKSIHRLCDKYTRNVTKILEEKYKCPLCNNYDPETKKKKKK